MSGKGKGGRGKKGGKSTSRSAKAGLQFPVGRVAHYLAVAVGLLDAAGGGGGLAGRLGGELLARRLAAGGFACCLLGAGHF